jgi:hypothetical protein
MRYEIQFCDKNTNGTFIRFDSDQDGARGIAAEKATAYIEKRLEQDRWDPISRLNPYKPKQSVNVVELDEKGKPKKGGDHFRLNLLTAIAKRGGLQYKTYQYL